MDALWNSVGPIKNVVGSLGNLLTPKVAQVEQIIIKEVQMASSGGRAFVRIAGISGAAAVCLGAYGSHGLFPVQWFG